MPLPLRADFDAAALRMAARRSKNAAQARCLLALAAVYDGSTRTEAARIGSVALQRRVRLGGEVQRDRT